MSAVIQADTTATRKTEVFRCMNTYKQLFLWKQSGRGAKLTIRLHSAAVEQFVAVYSHCF